MWTHSTQKKNVNTRWRHCALYLTTLLPNVSSLVKLALRRHNTVSGLRQKCFCKAWNNGLKALSSILLTICGAFFKQEAYFKGCPRVILHVAPISRAPCFFHPDFLPVTRCLLFWNALRAEVASLLSLPWRSLAGSRCNPAGCFASPVCDGGETFAHFFFFTRRIVRLERRPSPGEYRHTASGRADPLAGGAAGWCGWQLQRGRDGVGLQWPCTPLRAPTTSII